MEKHLDLLGMKATDQVTGFKGVVTTIGFDLYGCIQAVITPIAENNEYGEGRWFDVSRIKTKGKNPVMQRPDYTQGYIADGNKGPAEKPAFEK